MTKKKIISLAAVVVVIGLLVLALTLLNRPEPVDESAASTPVEVIYALGQATPVPASQVTFTNEHGTFTLTIKNADAATSSEKEYTLAGYEGLPLNRSVLTGLADNGAKLIAKSVVAEGEGDKSLYGVDKPLATISSTLTDGTSASVTVGNAAPGNEGYYVTTGSDKIYLVNASYISSFLQEPMEFMDLSVTTGVPEESTFVEAALGGTVREEPIVVKPVEEGSTDTYSSHVITEPYRVEFDLTNGTAALQGAFGITAAKAVGVANTDADLEKFGLKEPYSTLQITPGAEMEMEAFTLSASQPDTDGNVNLRRTGSKLIYQVAASSLPWLEVQLHDVMSKMAILPHIDKVRRVTVASPDQTYAFDFSDGEGDDLVVACQGQELDMASFRKLYQSLIAASYESVAEEPLAEGAEPILTYTYEYKEAGKSADVVKFYEGPARQVYIVLNDGIPFLTRTVYMDKVLADIPKLLAGETISSYL